MTVQEERLERRRAYQVAWRQKNAAKLRAYGVEYRRNNVEKIRANNAAYRIKNHTKKLAYDVAYRKNNREKCLAAGVEWSRRNPAKIYASTNGWRKRNPDKRRAHGAVQTALKSGKLKRPEHCQGCGKPSKTHGHHSDYSKRLTVVWLCPRCHNHTSRHFFNPPAVGLGVGEPDISIGGGV